MLAHGLFGRDQERMDRSGCCPFLPMLTNCDKLMEMAKLKKEGGEYSA